jgi:cobyrinic acid a,c-diamide synthase
VTKGLVIAAPATGSGKTTLTLGLLRAFSRQGVAVASTKAGPDYIDPAFHAAASLRPCFSLDGWAMRPVTLSALAARAAEGAELLIAEGVMGLFDGAMVASGSDGSTADLAASLGLPVVLVVDVAGQAGSAAALVRGFASHRLDVRIAGVIWNRVGGPGHKAQLNDALSQACPEIRVLGAVPKMAGLALPSRHLGLVQAGEHGDLEGYIEGAASLAAAHIDLASLLSLAEPLKTGTGRAIPLPPLGRRIAVARDQAFAFAYEATLEGWRAEGAETVFFSPLAGEGPDESADAVYLPGGYPELHIPRIAAGSGFIDGLRRAAARGASIFGECGGYMVLGQALIDAEGRSQPMAGLLPLVTSFERRKLHLGYRQVRLLAESPLGRAGGILRGHEFHYASIIEEGPGEALFSVCDAAGNPRENAGLVAGKTQGSFIHLIDRA